MALPEDETTTEQPSIDYEALGLEPVSDEELFGFGLQTEAPEAPKAETPEIDYEALGLEPVSDKELFGFEMPKDEPVVSSGWDTLRGAEVSLRQVPQLAYGVAGLVGATSEQITGYGEALRDWGFRGYKEWEESMEPISKETDDITVAWDRAKQGDVGALVDWAQYGVGYALGQLGETAAVAVLGGLAGGAAGAPAGGVGAAPAAAGGAIVAAAGKQGFKALAKNLVEKAIASQATKIVARQAEKEGIELTAEQLAKRASQDAIKRQAGKEIGSNVAVFGNAIGMQLGSIYGEAESKAQAEGRDLTGYDLARVWGTGIATGGLEGVVDKLGLDLLKGKLSGVLPEGRLAGAAVAGGVGTFGEAATEGVQTVGERFGAGKDIFGDEALNEYINAAALGGLGGGVIGGAGGFISGNPKENAAAKAKVAAEASKNIAPESSKLVSDQADAVINEVAQETPDQRVARLQREAKEAAGEIPLEGEPAITPPTPEVAPTPEIAQAAQARIAEREGQAVTPIETPAGNRVEAAAYQAPDGTVYYGASHLDAMGKALDAGKIEQAEINAKQEAASRETPEFGFATNADPFVTRDQAETIARQSGQITVEQPATGKLHSNEVSLDAFAQPATPEAAPTTVKPTPVTEAAPPITATRTVADAIRDKDTFIYNGQRGAVSVEDGVTVFRPFGTQEKFEIGINPNQKLGEIEGIEWARKGQVRATPVEPKPENSSIIESKPKITTDEIDQAKPDFEVPVSLIEIEKSKTLNDLADLFDTGESKIVQEGNRARKVSQTPEFYRQATPQQIDLAKRLIDNALRIIDALSISDQQKQDMAEPFLLLDQDINNYENNPEYQRYKASIRTEVRPDGEVSAFPTTETEVAAWIKESEQRAAAKAGRLGAGSQLEPLRRVARAEQTQEDVAGLVDSGLIEIYKGQPVLTQAGIDSLPESERPRLTPEARKIQIDTGASDVVAEAISKKLRIGVDQVPVDFQMPTGWVLEGDVYIPSRFTTLEELYSDFDSRGAGHAKFRTRLDSMVNEEALTGDARDMILATLFDNNVNDEFLMNIEVGPLSGRAIRTYGRGGFGRQQVAGPTGPMVGYKPSLKLFRNTRKEYPNIDERSAQILSTFWHEYGHVGYYSLLDQKQKNIIDAEFNKTTKEQRQKFFEEGVAGARQTEWFRKYYAKNQSEWFAQSFAEYVLTKKSDNKKLVPVFENILDKIKNVFNKLFNRTETANLEDIFEFILRGEAYGTKPIWYGYGIQMSREPSIYTGGPQIIRGARETGVEAAVEAPTEVPTFTAESPEAATLKEMATSMAKVDAASEAKGGKPETYKISEIAANWMEQGGDERALQDAITENTNLSPANAAKVAKAIARQYDIQQSIATAFLETQTGSSVEALPEGVTLPKEVDPDRPKPVMQRLFEAFMGVRVPPVKIQVNEKTALKQQIRLKAAANRAAKAEQKRTAEEVVEIIKAMELLGPVRPKQVQALAKRAARVIWTNEKNVEAFSEYAAKVVENANYDADLREAKDAQKRAKQLSKQKKVAMSPQRQILEDVGRVPVNKLDDPRMFADAVNYYLRGFKDVLSPDYVVIPDAEMESYLSGAQSETQRNQRDLDREANKRLAEKYGIDPEQVNEMMESIDILKQIEAQENREALENLLTEKAVETQQGLRGYDTDNLQADQRPIVASMLKIDPKALDPEERQRFIRITNNIIYNNQTNGAEYFVAVAKGQQSAREAAQDSTMVAKNRAWINLLPRFISERMQRGWALELQSVADTFRNAFGKGAMAKMYDAMGMLDLNLGFTKANNVIDEIQEKIAEFHRNLEKKYKAAARNQDGLLAEGVVGFLIQSVPKKDELSSINQRRDLIRQDIANRRRATGEPDRVAMADRIEAILNRIDGESVEAILNNMNREFPANHESLVWYKDTLLPQYKDFLKGFDENFNDQANNYENPNYLTIGFTSAGPSLAITPEEQGMFYDQVSLRPKQSAYTIKRVDYTTLPTDRTTGKPKEIEFNLRRNVFNGLSDQINKAYTSSGWQRIASFMKTPEAEIVFGGAANKDFFIERLNRLRLSRMRRGSMGSGGAIEKAVDSLSVISRKLGTGIALGGIYQWIKQPPDQLITALGSGGRYDLLAKNIAPSTQKAARELLNKFSIGRRGDASSGYKYINQMEGHQNRLERYFSESKWDQAKEQAGKVADVWMVALKSSDFLAASAAWMTYYEGELNKQDIKIDDWSKEAELIESDPARRQAAAFAEQMTDIYQGSSDPTSMATFAQSGKTGWENLVKAIFVPFNSFAIQQRMRLYSDARDVLNGSAGGKGGLAGTIGGLILFHATKRYVIPAISGAGIAVLYGLMGVDMEEPDEEKQKEEANKNWRQFLADITGNLLVGGTPQIVESQFIDAMNRASYLVSLQLENDSILNDEGEIMSYDQYSKERSPFYRYKSFDNAMSLGMLEIGLGQAEQVALQTKMLATPEEMEMYTPEEQRLLYFSTLSEWLYLMRLNDADFARLVSRARRDMIKAAEEREKEIKRIRSGR